MLAVKKYCKQLLLFIFCTAINDCLTLILQEYDDPGSTQAYDEPGTTQKYEISLYYLESIDQLLFVL